MKKGFRILKFKKDRPFLEVKEINKSFDGRPILKKLSLRVFPGECVGVLGPNGCGKTTLFSICIGEQNPEGGKIYLNNKAIDQIPMHLRSKEGLGYLPQQRSVFNMSVYDNIIGIAQISIKDSQMQKEVTEKLLDEFKKRLEEQKERHEGGDKWVGTGGTSPYGNSGMNPEGIRVGGEGGKGKAAKVWEARDFKNLDDDVELGTRNMKVALRRLRKLIRDSADEEFDLDNTISSTAKKAGLLDVKFRPEKRNAVKVLVLFDVGGSMDPHIRVCEELFSAAKTEFKNLEYFYFHNFIYETVWKDNRRRQNERVYTEDIIHKYSADYKIIFVGDATMAPYEITNPGGSIEHWNEEAGALWMKRMVGIYDKLVWLNPVPKEHWEYSASVELTRSLVEDNMFPLTIRGLEESMAYLSK